MYTLFFGDKIDLVSLIDNLLLYFYFESPWRLILAIIDVLVVAFLIYKLLVLIRDTRAWQLIKGVLFILITARVSEWLGLKTFQFILDNTIQYIALALLIIFQPELRRALEHLGRNKLSQLLVNQQTNAVLISNVIETIVSACEIMAKDKTGALIVIEGKTKLGDVMDDSTELDSKVSSSLILNVFEKDTPLHDGAMIIRDTRIKAAACYLPLAKSTLIPKELGTRHRAAIGISEVSDALAIVVSEETGQISTALNGNLHRGLSSDLLRLKLKQQFGVEENKESRKNTFIDTVLNYFNKQRGDDDE